MKTGDRFETLGGMFNGGTWRWVMVKRGNVAGWAAIERVSDGFRLFDYALDPVKPEEPETPRSGVTLPEATVGELADTLQVAVDGLVAATAALERFWKVLDEADDVIESGS